MPERICSIDGCKRVPEKRGLCNTHYQRWRHHGDPNREALRGPVPRPPHERVLARTMKTGGCWLWQGALLTTGYASVIAGSAADGTRRKVGAHRAVYEGLVGPIPAGHDIHHICGVRHCVNPAHLEPISRGDHVRLHDPIGARWAATR